VEEQISRAVQSITEGDLQLAKEVVDNDYRINALEVAIDEECTRIVAERHPGASDLRLVMAVIKTITDLERMGDEAKRVARMVAGELNGTIDLEIREELEHMGQLVRDMLRRVLDAFARTDEEMAMVVFELDKRVDAKYWSITRQLMNKMAEDTRAIPFILNLLWAIRSIERMGDRCQNIAEYIFYLVHGKDIRHIQRGESQQELRRVIDRVS
ncbi:MAG TPA: phosphate signaling complex protein PhoU, partial [Xanthomonadales bacterium]|nr:phosphate signaling complex protein PhoU [Xanthomonadales bacterium]